jgi:hypothetical protein
VPVHLSRELSSERCSCSLARVSTQPPTAYRRPPTAYRLPVPLWQRLSSFAGRREMGTWPHGRRWTLRCMGLQFGEYHVDVQRPPSASLPSLRCTARRLAKTEPSSLEPHGAPAPPGAIPPHAPAVGRPFPSVHLSQPVMPPPPPCSISPCHHRASVRRPLGVPR